MSTEVAIPGGLGALAKGLKRAKTQMPSFGGKSYLKFGKDGEWSCGRGGEAANERRVLFNVAQLKAGYVCWTNYPADQKRKNEKLGEEMALVTMGAVDPGELPDLGWEWKQQQSVEGRFLDGDKEEFVYVVSSLGGLEAMDKVIDAVMERVEAGDTAAVFPVVKLLDDWYDHPQWGKTYKPILEVVAWADIDGVIEGAEEKKAVTKQPEAEAEEDEADEPPVRRRRR